jgi:hypothetical protein
MTMRFVVHPDFGAAGGGGAPHSAGCSGGGPDGGGPPAAGSAGSRVVDSDCSVLMTDTVVGEPVDDLCSLWAGPVT